MEPAVLSSILLSKLFHKLKEFQGLLAGERLVSRPAVGLSLLLTELRRPQAQHRPPQEDLCISHRLHNSFYNQQSRCCRSTCYTNNHRPNYSFCFHTYGATCGFQTTYTWFTGENITLSPSLFDSDVDECAEGLSSCGENSQCLNLPGSHRCQCQRGFEFGYDRRTCIGE